MNRYILAPAAARDLVDIWRYIKKQSSLATADRVESGMAPQEAAQQALYYLKTRLNGHGGIIILDARGRIGLAHNTPRMAWALRSQQERKTGVNIQS